MSDDAIGGDTERFEATWRIDPTVTSRLDQATTGDPGGDDRRE